MNVLFICMLLMVPTAIFEVAVYVADRRLRLRTPVRCRCAPRRPASGGTGGDPKI